MWGYPVLTFFCHNSILALKGDYWDGCRNWSVMVPVLFCTYFGVLYFTNESYKLPIFETFPLEIVSWPSRAGGLTSCQWKYVRGVMLKSHRLRQTGIKEQRKRVLIGRWWSWYPSPSRLSSSASWGILGKPSGQCNFRHRGILVNIRQQIAFDFQPPEMVS